MQVIKRDGTLEDLNIDKLHKVVMFSCEGITGVSASEVEIHSQIQFFEKIKTCLLYTSPSPRDQRGSRMPSSA